jgi:hypothetical protein
MVWRQEDGVADEGVIYAQMEGMAVDEVSIFSFKEPWKCKHCKRVFGHEVDAEEVQVLFNKLVDEVRMKSLHEYLEKLGIPKEAAVFKYVKCPSCSCPPDYGKWMADVFPSPPWVREVSGFYIYKYKCQECSKEFFGVLDIYDNDMMMRKFMY